MSYTHQSIIDEIEDLKTKWLFTQAIKKVNQILVKNPHDEDALLQIADIQYRQWQISSASKAVDFLNSKKDNNDPLVLYIKWVLEMEKNSRRDAKKYLQKAMTLTKSKNHEIVRCYALCEYRYGNREKWLKTLEDAFAINDLDAEIIYNMVELYLLEWEYKKAKKILKYFRDNHSKIQTVDKPMDYYDMKLWYFEKFLDMQTLRQSVEKVKSSSRKKTK